MLFRLGEKSPVIDPQSGFIADTAILIGNVIVGRLASVWFQSVIRGDNDLIDIGAQSNIQDGAILHTDLGYPLIIGKGVTVGHKALLHGCAIGDFSLIGMNATILNGAKVGQNCIIGAHSLISEGKVIPDNSVVVGVPGKIIRQVTLSDIDLLKASAASYVEKSLLYSKQLILLPNN